MNILFLDFCSDKNRGDAAMQVGIIKLVKKYFPNCNLKILAWYGTNQQEALNDEFFETKCENLPILGGLRSTFFDFGNAKVNYGWKKKLKIIISLCKCVSTLFGVLLFKDRAKFFIRNIRAKESFLNILCADLIIWNGRNFRGSSYFKEIYTILTLCYHPLICIFLKKDISIIGLSLWELKNPVSRKICKYCFSKCFLITAREEHAYTNLKELIPEHKNIHLLPDLSFAYLKDLNRSINNNEKTTSEMTKPKIVGLTIVDWKAEGEIPRKNYKKSIVDIINHLNNCGVRRFIIVPQVTTAAQENNLIVDEILNKLEVEIRNNCQVINKELTVKELIQIYKEVDLLIATRMHSAIFALSVDTPITCISYDSGGKWGILEKFGIRILPFSKISSKRLIKEVNYTLDNWGKSRELRHQNLLNAYNNVDNHISLLYSSYNSVN